MDSGLFNITLSDSEGEDGGAVTETTRDRTGQTEDAFRAVKRAYQPKLDDGEVRHLQDFHSVVLYKHPQLTFYEQIWKSVQVPLGQRKLSKQEAQEVLHAVEELYFYRRFGEAVTFIGRVFEGEGGAAGLEGDVKDLLRLYESKCMRKLGRSKENA